MAYLIVIHEQPTTFVFGTFRSEEMAEEALVRLISDQIAFKNLSNEFKHEFGSSIKGLNNLHKYLFQSQDADISDFFGDRLNATILHVPADTLFNFTPWTNWDERNLYDTLCTKK